MDKFNEAYKKIIFEEQEAPKSIKQGLRDIVEKYHLKGKEKKFIDDAIELLDSLKYLSSTKNK